MSNPFESQKNMKATGYTALVCTVLLIMLIYISWTRPAEPVPVVEQGIEVNLGNSDQGLGKDQPYLPGDPSPQDKQKYTPPKQAVVEKEPVKDVETDDNQKEDAPVVKKALVTKPDATKIPDKETTKTKVKPVKVPETLPEKPKPIPHPKAVFRGVNGTGNGGNNADDYKQGGNEGVAGGHGDQGAPGGDPNSTNYTGGGHGNSGIAIRGLSGRHMVNRVSFTGDFNENAKVAVTVHVNANGTVTSAEYSLMGSTTSIASYKDLAIEKAKLVKFNPGADDQVGTLIFNFQIHN